MIFEFNNEYFNIKDTLECGQIFRFKPFLEGYLVFSQTKVCYVYNKDNRSIIECEDEDKDYFYHYFDLQRDYSLIYNSAVKFGGVLSQSAKLGKGIRILNQDKMEMLFSFIVSQNNNIPRIKGIIERLCLTIGEKQSFLGEEYFAFPTVKKMAEKDLDFYKSIGLGYRAPYILELAKGLNSGLNINDLDILPTMELKKKLLSIYGVGPKVADCVLLFGFHRSDSFPVDTWIEKVYRENFNGSILDRNKIAQWFVEQFGDNSGYFQQYLFYFKRSLEKTE